MDTRPIGDFGLFVTKRKMEYSIRVARNTLDTFMVFSHSEETPAHYSHSHMGLKQNECNNLKPCILSCHCFIKISMKI